MRVSRTLATTIGSTSVEKRLSQNRHNQRHESDRLLVYCGDDLGGPRLADRKPQRIQLKPDSANNLSGTSDVSLPAHLKGAAQIMLPVMPPAAGTRAGQVRVKCFGTSSRGPPHETSHWTI